MSADVTTGLPDLANLRDTGGLPTYDGRRTRTGRLLRSATPYHLDAAQVAVLTGGLGVQLRIDLRSRGEVAGATNAHLTTEEHAVLLAPLSSGGRDVVPDIADPVAAMTAHYLRFLEHAGESFAAIARAVVAPGRVPALVHCTLGKDRTGVTVALLLSSVGVTDDAVVADYALTQGRTDALLARLREVPGYRERLAELPAEGLAARPATMVAFLTGVRATYGDARGYLGSVGVSDVTLDALTDLLVEA